MSILDTSDTVWDNVNNYINEQALRDAIREALPQITYIDILGVLPNPINYKSGNVIGVYHGSEMESYILLEIQNVTGKKMVWYQLGEAIQLSGQAPQIYSKL